MLNSGTQPQPEVLWLCGQAPTSNLGLRVDLLFPFSLVIPSGLQCSMQMSLPQPLFPLLSLAAT